MRGIVFPDIANLVAEAGLMSQYNQQYSELENIPYRKVIFLMRLLEAEDKYNKEEMKKSKSRGRRLRI